MLTRSQTRAASFLVLLAVSGCASAPGGGAIASGLPPTDPTQQAAGTERRHTAADVAFMHGMTMHHAQALEMTALVPDRARNDQVKLLAQRIDVSQRDELARIERWLSRRGEAAAHAAGGDHAMHPGMLTAAELQRLAGASGPDFDRLFLEYMIRHHQGALEMVATLFGTPGTGQESETYQFASEVDADQRAEISRMQALLRALP